MEGKEGVALNGERNVPNHHLLECICMHVYSTLTIVSVGYLLSQGMVVTPNGMGHCCH